MSGQATSQKFMPSLPLPWQQDLWISFVQRLDRAESTPCIFT